MQGSKALNAFNATKKKIATKNRRSSLPKKFTSKVIKYHHRRSTFDKEVGRAVIALEALTKITAKNYKTYNVSRAAQFPINSTF